MRMTFALTAALLLPLVSTAAPVIQQSALEECGALPQAGMRECLATKAAESQALLERAQSETASALTHWDEDSRYAKFAKEKFDASNKAFERYRETECAFAAALGGGAIANALELRRLACVIDLDRTRAAKLSAGAAALPRR